MDGLGKEMRGAIRPEPMFQRPEGRRPAYRAGRGASPPANGMGVATVVPYFD